MHDNPVWADVSALHLTDLVLINILYIIYLIKIGIVHLPSSATKSDLQGVWLHDHWTCAHNMQKTSKHFLFNGS